MSHAAPSSLPVEAEKALCAIRFDLLQIQAITERNGGAFGSRGLARVAELLASIAEQAAAGARALDGGDAPAPAAEPRAVIV